MNKDIKKGNLGKQNKNQIISSERKKKLMKILARIKLNNSRANNSFFDISALYEAKVRKLRLNNVSLAKALADQKQVSQTWYDTVVTLKEELHDTQESLLRLHYQVKENGDYEHIIQESVERRIRAIAEPLDASISESLKNVYSLVENLTTVKQLLSSTLSFNTREKLNFSRSSHGSHGSRPPLSQNSKSPRKNVVHPMVEGHVLQPATIHLPRMTLEEKRRYRLQEQAESRMEVIGEQSVDEQDFSTTSDNDDPTSDNQNMEENLEYNVEVSTLRALNEDPSGHESEISTPEHIELSELLEDSSIPENENSANKELPELLEDPCIDENENSANKEVALQSESLYGSKCDLPISEESISEEILKSSQISQKITLQSESSCGSKCDLPISEESVSEEILKSEQMAQNTAHDYEEDPLEGSSWMHLKRKRPVKSKSRSRNTNVRTSGIHYALDTSSDSEDDSIEIPVTKIKHGKIKGSSRKRPSRTKSSKVSISHLDLLSSKVSKRCKKSTGSSISSERNSKDPTWECEEHKSPTLPSFIINDSDIEMPILNENQNLKTNLKGDVRLGSIENRLHLSTSSPCSGQNFDPVVNLTCISNSSMEITDCLPKEVLKNSEYITEQSSAKLLTKVDDNFNSKADNQNNSNDIEQNKTSEHFQSHKSVVQECRKGNKYFKTSLPGNDSIEVVSKKQPESCVYDISLMDASQLAPNLISVDKENVPPSTNDNSNAVEMKIKDISIIVKDILKSPYPKLDSESNSPFYGFPNTSKETDNLNKLNKSTNVKTKGKNKKTNDCSLRKVSKNPKFFSDNYSITIYSSPSATDDDDIWSPSKQTSKRKGRQSKKSINSRKKQKHQSGKKSEKNVILSNSFSTTEDISEVEDNTKAINFNSNNTDNVNLQITNPLQEIPMDSNSIGQVSSEIFKDVNDIIRKHIRKEIEHIPSFESCEVIELKSDDDVDPLAISNIDLFSIGRRRAALKIQSLKEPALNTKMRRKSVTKKVKKEAPKKKSMKT